MYYHAKVFTATATGRKLREVACEKCGAAFCYELVRVGKGQSSAPYGMGQNAALRRAQQKAQKDLAKRLARDAELVPCPSCQHVNAIEIVRFRKAKYKTWTSVAVFSMIGAAAVDLIVYVGQEDAGRMLVYVLLAGVGIVILSLALQIGLRLRINPNRRVNGRPVIPPGTPSALVKQASATGETVLVPVASEYSNLQEEATWAVFRPGQLVFEPMCCQCLDVTAAIYKTPLKLGGQALSVPVCPVCQRRIFKQVIVRTLVVLPMALLFGWLGSQLIGGLDDAGRIICIVLVGAAAAVAGLIVVMKTVQPYRIRTVDA